jgi:hypothetical protein
MTKKHTILLLTCLAFILLIVSVYLYRHNSDHSGKMDIMNTVQEENKKFSDFSSRSGEAGQGTDVGSGTESNSRQGSANRPPIIEKARLQLESLNNRDSIKVIATGTDKDNDPVTFVYAWFRNGESAGSGEILSEFSRGDKIVAMVTPYDGKDYGVPKSLTLEIKNSTPQISGYKEMHFDGNKYAGQIIASDPDGDTLSYSLASAPSGMTIDPSTGMIKWNVSSDFKGTSTVKVSVSDGQGGITEKSFSLTIK